MLHIIFPFLEKIGVLWLTGHINPAQEHLVTNVIRQKLIVAIETTVTHLQTNRTVLLFLPEGEYHELGLLYVYYMLKNRGVKTIYLGANVPVIDMAYVANLKKPDLVFTHLTATPSGFNFDKFLLNLDTRISDIPIIVSGQLTRTYSKNPPPGVIFKKSLQEVTEYLSM